MNASELCQREHAQCNRQQTARQNVRMRPQQNFNMPPLPQQHPQSDKQRDIADDDGEVCAAISPQDQRMVALMINNKWQQQQLDQQAKAQAIRA